jgi:hypothetical protein
MVNSKLNDNTACNEAFCEKVMNEVACNEERRLIHTLMLMGPLLILSSWLIVVAIHLSIVQLIEHNAIEVISGMRAEGHAFSQQAFILLQLFGSQMREDLLALLAIGLVVVFAIIMKSKLHTFPFRFKEIKKYKTPELEN